MHLVRASQAGIYLLLTQQALHIHSLYVPYLRQDKFSVTPASGSVGSQNQEAYAKVGQI